MTFQEEINETSWKAKIIFSLFLSIEAIFFCFKIALDEKVVHAVASIEPI